MQKEEEFILEVNLEYPNEIYDSQKDLTFCPENRVPPGFKNMKLMATLYKKENYIIHYRYCDI